MRHPSPGRFKSLAAFAAHAAQVAPGLRADEVLRGADGPFGQPVMALGRRLANRFACHPMEGWDGTPEGGPTELTLRRWRRFGESGAALIWGGEAYAVCRAGRANPRQLFHNSGRDCAGDLARLLAAARCGGALVGLQLTHSGRFARPEGPLVPRCVHRHPLLERKYPHDAAGALLSDAELEGIGEDFVAAARLAQRVGFDFVDLKCCHGYLLHETLAARSRSGPYGGEFAGRTRFFLRVVDAVRAACPGLGVGVRLSLGDTVPFERGADGVGRPMDHDLPYALGFGVDQEQPLRCDFSEPLRLLALLRARGVTLLNVTLGSPYWNPHLQRPAAYPPSDGYQPPADPLTMVARHLEAAQAAKAAQPDMLVVGAGWTYLQEFLPYYAQHELAAGGADFIGLGRMLLSYPELPRDLLAGREPDRRRLCRTFSDCTTAPRNGMVSGCFPLDAFYRAMPEAAGVRALRPEEAAD